jgi:hypothetical protein
VILEHFLLTKHSEASTFCCYKWCSCHTIKNGSKSNGKSRSVELGKIHTKAALLDKNKN